MNHQFIANNVFWCLECHALVQINELDVVLIKDTADLYCRRCFDAKEDKKNIQTENQED